MAQRSDAEARSGHALTASGFTEPPEGHCVGRFADEGMIEGRRVDPG